MQLELLFHLFYYSTTFSKSSKYCIDTTDISKPLYILYADLWQK